MRRPCRGWRGGRLRVALAALALAAVCGPAAAACGGGSSLAEPAPCATPTPAATTGSSSSKEIAYRTAILRGVRRLADLNQAWIDARPSRKISNSASFRGGFAEYADASVCVASALRELSPPLAKYAEFDSALDAQLDVTIEVMTFGRTAVARRNTSDYRDWNKRIDARASEIQAVIATMPARQ